MPSEGLLETVFNASLALAGILLVFVGFVYTQAQSFPPGTARDITDKFINAAKFGVVPFTVAIVLAGLSFYDLTNTSMSLWNVLQPLFWVELAILFLYGVISVLLYLG